MSDPKDNGTDKEDTQKTSTGGKLLDVFSKVTDKIPEGPLLGHVIPGWMAAHKVISGIIIAGVGIPIAAIILGAGHAWLNSSYTEDYQARLDDIAKESAMTCSLDDQDRKEKTYKRVQGDIRDAGDSSVFGIALAPVSMIPFIGSIAPSFEWLPNKRIDDALKIAQQNNIKFFRGNGFKGDIRAVIFKDSEKPPVMVYKNLDDGELVEIMNVVRENKGVKQGALVLSWNDAREKFETAHVEPGAKTVPVMAGISSAPMPVNSCLTDNSITTRTIDGIKGLMPDFGSKDKKDAQPTAPIAVPPAEQKKEGDGKSWYEWRPSWNWGSDDKEKAPETPPQPSPR